MAFRWLADDGPTLSAGFVIYQGIRTSFAKKPFDFVIFREGSRTPAPPPPSLDPRMQP